MQRHPTVVRGLGAELGLLGRGHSDGDPWVTVTSGMWHSSSPVSGADGTGHVRAGLARPSDSGACGDPAQPWAHPTLGGAAREEARTELAAVLTLSNPPAGGQEDTARLQTLLAQDVLSLRR